MNLKQSKVTLSVYAFSKQNINEFVMQIQDSFDITTDGHLHNFFSFNKLKGYSLNTKNKTLKILILLLLQ